ncbi:tetratricopeptide repeat protein [Candidatus Njordibacter sp. Uisw_058]|uniref:tetratricopeptide repeat protein n=1 Tax=Candidatus Njordibacter sp. Uisw_058 TaxID=3230974 RepID=UPI003D43534F
MELTVEQALQQGVAAHREGKLQEAERLYRAILQSQPLHPDANHNLGILAVSVNKADAALPLFKTALEANPKIEQFWLSYIDALIKANQFDDANAVLEQGKKVGLVRDKVDAVETHITPTTEVNEPKLNMQKKSLILSEKRKKLAENKNQKKAKKQNLKAISPSEAEIKSLLEHYENGRYDDADKLAKSITQQFPSHQFAWKVLGALLKQTGRISESLVANQKSVQLMPQDAEAQSNLGNTLQELGRLEEAEASCRQAIALKPDLAEAHNNLGITLQELGRLDEAEASYTQAIALKPDSFVVHYNLGIILQEIGRLDEAEASYKKVVALKSDYAEAHNSLLMCFYLLDKQSLFFDKLDYLINEDTSNATIGSLTCRSALKYGVEKPNLFCREPLQYVSHIDMNTQYDFEEIFVGKARFILNEDRVSNRKQPLLVNGYQTSGNLFDIKDSFTEQIQKAIRLEIEKYRSNFKDSKDGLIKKWPTEYSLYGWLISMKSGGELKPHIHSNAWLSGSLYINVPPKSKAESGNLVVSLGEEIDATDTRINVKEIINVVTGSLVLFPASLTHYTIPFEAEEERIVLAFDVKPK